MFLFLHVIFHGLHVFLESFIQLFGNGFIYTTLLVRLDCFVVALS